MEYFLYIVVKLENKELLQQSAMDTRHSTRSRQNKQQKQDVVSNKKRKVVSDISVTSSSELQSPVQTSTGNVYVQQMPIDYPIPNPSSQGKLIVVPPHISHFISTNINNPSLIRAYIGDYYWNALCVPNPNIHF